MNNTIFLSLLAGGLVLYYFLQLMSNPPAKQSSETIYLCQIGHENECGEKAWEDNFK